jgi:hypothetical protein
MLFLHKLENFMHTEILQIVRFEILTAVIMKNTVFWNLMPYSLVEVGRRFGRTYYLYL